MEILCDRKLKRISDFSSDNRIISVMLYRNFPSNTLFLRIHAYIRIYVYFYTYRKGNEERKGRKRQGRKKVLYERELVEGGRNRDGRKGV